ncbi:hypothetical protein, partial [Robertkochia marina]|uniref:hypothetical protein n=1 Tax=Robertkochia marina TaxID=1227945 RepID=UPI001A7EBFE2
LWEVSAKKVKNFSSLIRLPHLKIDYKKVPSALRMTHNGRAMHRCGMGQLGDLLAFGVPACRQAGEETSNLNEVHFFFFVQEIKIKKIV